MIRLSKKTGDLDNHIQEVLAACLETVIAKHPNAQVVLFGSYARGEADEESDLDLLIVIDGEVSPAMKELIRDNLYEISLSQDVVISTLIQNVEAWNRPVSKASPIYQAIEKEGIRLT